MNLSKQIYTKRLYRLQLVLLLGFLSIFCALFYWTSIRGENIISREDNPRLVEATLRIARGEILDRNGNIVALSQVEENGRYTRQYPYQSIGPAVGYYNFRHGTAGAEAAFDDILSGDPISATAEWRQKLFAAPQTGFDIQLSLDAALQTAASDLLASYEGALLLIDIPSGEILALVSHPGYDPNRLEANFAALSDNPTAPLLNRALQGNYQPGRVLQPFLLAAAIDQNMINLTDPVANIGLPLPIDGQTEECITTPQEPGDWGTVLQNRCPYPMFLLADRLGVTGLRQFYERFGFTLRPALLASEEVIVAQNIISAGSAAIGQDSLTVTPLQVTWAWGALLNDGVPVYPRLVTAVQNENGVWQSPPTPGSIKTAASTRTTRTLRELLVRDNELFFSVPVLSGPGGDTNTWVLGAAPASAPTTMLVMILEDYADWLGAEELGQTLLQLRDR